MMVQCSAVQCSTVLLAIASLSFPPGHLASPLRSPLCFSLSITSACYCTLSVPLSPWRHFPGEEGENFLRGGHGASQLLVERNVTVYHGYDSRIQGRLKQLQGMVAMVEGRGFVSSKVLTQSRSD